MSVRQRVLIVGALVLGALAGSAPAVGAGSRPSGPSFATFEGTVIDLRTGWGEATACLSDGVSTSCFRTEAELDAALSDPSQEAGSAAGIDGPVALALSCSGQLRLWTGNSYSGSVLALTTRGVILNLWTYPGSTSAGSMSAVMASGWNNVVSSVYIS
jgi:hypothetical protein